MQDCMTVYILLYALCMYAFSYMYVVCIYVGMHVKLCIACGTASLSPIFCPIHYTIPDRMTHNVCYIMKIE